MTPSTRRGSSEEGQDGRLLRRLSHLDVIRLVSVRFSDVSVLTGDPESC